MLCRTRTNQIQSIGSPSSAGDAKEKSAPGKAFVMIDE
jgi:hypothetical protein